MASKYSNIAKKYTGAVSDTMDTVTEPSKKTVSKYSSIAKKYTSGVSDALDTTTQPAKTAKSKYSNIAQKYTSAVGYTIDGYTDAVGRTMDKVTEPKESVLSSVKKGFEKTFNIFKPSAIQTEPITRVSGGSSITPTAVNYLNVTKEGRNFLRTKPTDEEILAKANEIRIRTLQEEQDKSKAEIAGSMLGEAYKFGQGYVLGGQAVESAVAPVAERIGMHVGARIAPALPSGAIGTGIGTAAAETAAKIATNAAPTLATEFSKDVLIGQPINYIEGKERGLEGKELAEYMGEQAVIDVIANGVFYVGGKAIGQGIDKLRGLNKTQLDDAIKAKATETTLDEKTVREAVNNTLVDEVTPTAEPRQLDIKTIKTTQPIIDTTKIYDADGYRFKVLSESGDDLNVYNIDTGNQEVFPKSFLPEAKDISVEKTLTAIERDFENVGPQNIKALQYENPELKPKFEERARELLEEAKDPDKGERIPIIDEDGYVIRYEGKKRALSDSMARIKDATNASYKKIETAIENIIKDEGAENNALSKRIELVIDDDLTEGYKWKGETIKPDIEYINLKQSISPEVKVTEPTIKPENKVKEPTITPKNKYSDISAKYAEPEQLKIPQESDTISKVLTEMPERVKTNVADKAERVYQEIFSTNIPFEKVGGPVRTQGSNLNRVQGTVEYNTVGKQVDMQGNEIGKSITDIFKDVPKENKSELFDYTLNKHNVDRFREGKPVFGEDVSGDMSVKKISEYSLANPQLETKQQEITQYFRNLMDEWAVKSGLVSEDTARMLQERYPNYVPTYRAIDLPKSMTQGNQNIAQVIKKAKGSEKAILPIDQQMIAMTERTVKNARKNELMNTLATAFEAGDSNANRYIKEIKGLEKESIDDLIDVGKGFDEVPVLKGDEYAVNFYTNGEPRQMIVNKTLYKALENTTSSEGINIVANAVKKYATNPFKALITGYNPIFAASNIMRDIPTALVYSSDPAALSKNVPKAVKEMTTNGELFKKFKALGGTREGLIGSGKEFKVPNLSESKSAFAKAQKLNPVKTVGDINNFTETLPRFSEFISVLEATGDPALAIYKSAELTTDFARHGKLTKLLDNFVPYLNPSVQGIDKFFRSFKDEPLKTAAKGAAFITVPTVILDHINKDNEAYNNLPARERNLYFNIPIPNSDKFIRIPKSRELGVAFSSIYDWAARASRGQEVTGEEIAQAIGENFTPADITAPIWTPAQKAWKQIKDPEAYETNYWGGLIVPQSMRRYSPGQQYDINSSGIAKAIGQQFEISPYVVDYLLKSYGGIIGQVVQPIGAEKETTLLAPLERKFITDPVFKSNSVNRFYEALDVAKKEAQDFNKKHNIPSEVVTPLEKEANYLNRLSLIMSDLREQQRQLQTQKGNDDRIRRLQIKINKIAKDGVK